MRALAGRLRELSAALEREMAGAAEAAAAHAAEVARRNVPVDTGALRDSISCRSAGLEAAAVAAAPYAAMVEYGTSRMAPRPFMLPAARESRGEFAGRARDALAGCLKEM